MSQDATFGTNTGHTDSTQPKPVETEHSRSVTDAVVADMLARRELGKSKYGRELMTFNGRHALLDLYQELLDATVYVKQMLMELDHLEQTILRGDGNDGKEPVGILNA